MLARALQLMARALADALDKRLAGFVVRVKQTVGLLRKLNVIPVQARFSRSGREKKFSYTLELVIVGLFLASFRLCLSYYFLV